MKKQTDFVQIIKRLGRNGTNKSQVIHDREYLNVAYLALKSAIMLSMTLSF